MLSKDSQNQPKLTFEYMSRQSAPIKSVLTEPDQKNSTTVDSFTCCLLFPSLQFPYSF